MNDLQKKIRAIKRKAKKALPAPRPDESPEQRRQRAFDQAILVLVRNGRLPAVEELEEKSVTTLENLLSRLRDERDLKETKVEVLSISTSIQPKAKRLKKRLDMI